MKIFIKSLKGDKTEVEVQLEDTVGALKQKMKELQGHEPEAQKLIAFGRIMEDAKTLAEYNLKDGDNVVIMVSKPKPQPRPQVSQPETAPVSTGPQGPSGAHGVPGQPPVQAPVLQGPEFEAVVQRIMELGMPRDQVEVALRAARGNPDIAIEFLMTGIPEPLAGGHAHAHQSPPGAAPAEGAAQGENPFNFLLQNPAMLQIRAAVQQNPALLSSLLQQISTTNPPLSRLIAQHPEDFRRFLTEQGPQIDPRLISALPRPGSGQIHLSPEEVAAIKNLASLGFSQDDALEAYLSCDKNEAMAANLLFENYVPLGAQREQIPVVAAPRQVQPQGSEQPPRSDQPPRPEQPQGSGQPPRSDQPPSDQPPKGDQPPSDQPPKGDQPPSDQPPKGDQPPSDQPPKDDQQPPS